MDVKFPQMVVANTQENFDLLDDICTDLGADWWIGEEDEEMMEVGFPTQALLEAAKVLLIEKSSRPWPRA
jgi:hypothetical protein